MRRTLLGVMLVILLGGCAKASPSVEPLHPSTPTASAAQVREAPRQVDRKPVIPRRFYSRRVGSAAVVPLHLEGSTLVPPSNPSELGWWGSKVGAKRGVTLLVGHTVHRAAWHIYGHGKLDNLEEVALGTDINVSGVHYTVSSNQTISKAALSRRAPHLFSQRGSHRLVVVTCENYDPATGTYRSNVVLVAK